MDHTQIGAHLHDWIVRRGLSSNDQGCEFYCAGGPRIQIRPYVLDRGVKLYFRVRLPTRDDRFTMIAAQREQCTDAFQAIAAKGNFPTNDDDAGVYWISQIKNLDVVAECVCAFVDAMAGVYGVMKFKRMWL